MQGLRRAFLAPYQRLAAWLPYTPMVLVVARALGGRASLRGMLAASTLYGLPHLFDWVRLVGPWGPFVGVALWVWGAAIYLRAVAVANELD